MKSWHYSFSWKFGSCWKFETHIPNDNSGLRLSSSYSCQHSMLAQVCHRPCYSLLPPWLEAKCQLSLTSMYALLFFLPESQEKSELFFIHIGIRCGGMKCRPSIHISRKTGNAHLFQHVKIFLYIYFTIKCISVKRRQLKIPSWHNNRNKARTMTNKPIRFVMKT